MKQILVAALFFLIYLTRESYSLQCYQCKTENDFYCGRTFKPDSYGVKVIECPSSNPCQKAKLPTHGDGQDSVQRGCNDESLCTEDSVCYTCEDDLCNSGSVMLPSLISLAVGKMVYGFF